MFWETPFNKLHPSSLSPFLSLVMYPPLFGKLFCPRPPSLPIIRVGNDNDNILFHLPGHRGRPETPGKLYLSPRLWEWIRGARDLSCQASWRFRYSSAPLQWERERALRAPELGSRTSGGALAVSFPLAAWRKLGCRRTEQDQ